MSAEKENLSTGQIEQLKRVLAWMIPRSAAYDVPGADDPIIVAEIMSSANHRTLGAALGTLDEQANRDFGKDFTSLSVTERTRTIETLTRSKCASLDALIGVVTRCYYRDERVMRSLGIPPRAPFPEGYQVPQGDFSLLEPVRNRGAKIYRDV